MSLRRIARLVAPALIVVLAFVAWELVPPWLSSFWGALPGSTRRSAVALFLQGLLVGYGVLLACVVLGLPILGVLLSLSQRPASSRAGLGRFFLLGVSLLVSLIALEASSLAWLAWLHRAPTLPAVAPGLEQGTRKPDLKLPTEFLGPGSGPTNRARDMRILVIGESSARGEPYHPWLSVGQIVGWQLEKVLPGLAVKVEIWAGGGATLESQHQLLVNLHDRPDAILVFSGHNEFQGRWAWDRDAPHYEEDFPRQPQQSLWVGLLRSSPSCRLILETLDRQRVDAAPPKRITRDLVDRPTCTAKERAEILADFRNRVEALATYCDSIGVMPIFIIPASNDGDYEPSRSVLPGTTSKEERGAFRRAFQRAREMESTEPTSAICAYRELIAQYPSFAESHFRLARLLRHAGAWDEAREHFVIAREADAMPLRCPEEFRQVYRNAAARHPSMVLVDCARILQPLGPHGILDDHLYHDAQHPNLLGYIALAQDLLQQLHGRHAFGWPAATPVPIIRPEECARHFGLDATRWAEVCDRSAWFHGVTAFIRHDPAERQAKEKAYKRAAELIKSGRPPEEAGMTGLGVHPEASPSR